jgi:hypothetical protein
MAQTFWVKLSADGDEYGPYPASEIRKFAAEGRLNTDSLVSLDHAAWHPASRIKGLFPAAPASTPASPSSTPAAPSSTPAPTSSAASRPPATQRRAVAAAPAPAAPPPEDDLYEVAARTSATATVAAAPSLGYYVPAAGDQFNPLRRRQTIPFLACAILMLLSGIAMVVFSMQLSNTKMPDGTKIMALLASSAAFFLCAIPTLILWLVWVGGTHGDLRRMSAGDYTISPAKAVGFSFIPLFDIFWAIYMPWRMAGEVNRHLNVRGLKPVSSGGVITCQILSVVVAPFFPGLTPVFYGVSMLQVQGGLNRLLTPAT